MPRKYGRIIPPALPHQRMLARFNQTVPLYCDLRQWDSPVKDQGEEGSCTAHAGTGAVEWIFRRYFSKSPIFSPQYTYAKELLKQGNFPQDQGSDGVTLCGTLIADGCCELALYPYVAGEINQPTVEQDTNARQYTLGAYHGLIGANTAISVLGDPVPWPVMIGFEVQTSFESDEVAETGIYNPQESENVIGGHEVMAIGYDVGAVPTIRPKDCPPALLIKNSWGESWGLRGYFWMALAVADSPLTDLKIAHSGKPWR